MEIRIASFVFILRLLMALGLYSFLAWALYTLWRDITMMGDEKGELTPASRIKLSEKSGDEFIFTGQEITLGRHPACDFVSQDETVSLRHARLYFDSGQWWLEDLGSRNGTFFNNVPVEAASVVTNQDEIRIGQIALTIEILNQRSEK